MQIINICSILKKGANLSVMGQFGKECASIILKIQFGAIFLRKGSKKRILVLKNVKVDFEVALRVGGINECKLKNYCWGQFSRKLVI